MGIQVREGGTGGGGDGVGRRGPPGESITGPAGESITGDAGANGKDAQGRQILKYLPFLVEASVLNNGQAYFQVNLATANSVRRGTAHMRMDEDSAPDTPDLPDSGPDDARRWQEQNDQTTYIAAYLKAGDRVEVWRAASPQFRVRGTITAAAVDGAEMVLDLDIDFINGETAGERNAARDDINSDYATGGFLYVLPLPPDAAESSIGNPKEQTRTYQVGDQNPLSKGAYAYFNPTGRFSYIRVAFDPAERLLSHTLHDAVSVLQITRAGEADSISLPIQDITAGGKRLYNEGVGEEDDDELWVLELKVLTAEVPAFVGTPGSTHFFFWGTIDPGASSALQEAQEAKLAAAHAYSFLRRPSGFTTTSLNPANNGTDGALYWNGLTQFFVLLTSDRFEHLRNLGDGQFIKAVFLANDLSDTSDDLSSTTRRWEFSIPSVAFATNNQRLTEGNWVRFNVSPNLPAELTTASSTRWVSVSFEVQDQNAAAIAELSGGFYGLRSDATPTATNRTAKVTSSTLVWSTNQAEQDLITASGFAPGDTFFVVGYDEGQEPILGASVRTACDTSGIAFAPGHNAQLSCATGTFPPALLTAFRIGIYLRPGSKRAGDAQALAFASANTPYSFTADRAEAIPTASSDSIQVTATQLTWSAPAPFKAAMLAIGFKPRDFFQVSALDANGRLVSSEYEQSSDSGLEQGFGGGNLILLKRSGDITDAIRTAAKVNITLLPGSFALKIAEAAAMANPLVITGMVSDSNPSESNRAINLVGKRLRFYASPEQRIAIAALGFGEGDRYDMVGYNLNLEKLSTIDRVARSDLDITNDAFVTLPAAPNSDNFPDSLTGSTFITIILRPQVGAVDVALRAAVLAGPPAWEEIVAFGGGTGLSYSAGGRHNLSDAAIATYSEFCFDVDFNGTRSRTPPIIWEVIPTLRHWGGDNVFYANINSDGFSVNTSSTPTIIIRLLGRVRTAPDAG